MTLSKQKGPRKNGPFCLLIFYWAAVLRLYHKPQINPTEIQHGECGKKARPLSRRREAESVSDEIM